MRYHAKENNMAFYSHSTVNQQCTTWWLGNRVKNKINQRINKKVDAEVDKSLDEIEGKKPAGSSGNTTVAPNEPIPATQTETVKSFSKFDFVPGEKIIYTEDFAQDAIGELPLNWNSTGKGEVVSLEKQQGKWLRCFKTPLTCRVTTKSLIKTLRWSSTCCCLLSTTNTRSHWYTSVCSPPATVPLPTTVCLGT